MTADVRTHDFRSEPHAVRGFRSFPRTDAPFAAQSQAIGMSDTDILGIILGAIAILMFVTGILLVI
ncbi:hypothetical protein HFX_0875 [Haloferax mediterranei ATCC 33500]|uniref:Uncharacterized protein n=2 Tax=Haloferax mediterranei (strain ATCC 33500 / DSM 1411 / JCM 8866 / NBRC 14739 / NCIMB 2177 / R-4) TaxID=523841 RepID=I3R2Y7_HALMT|nr:hypothetical protein HFX_0875 [Haloferax mediterranei ATCC 33500]